MNIINAKNVNKKNVICILTNQVISIKVPKSNGMETTQLARQQF